MANIIDSYSETNVNQYVPVGSTNKGIAQSFTGNGATLGSAKFYIYMNVAATGTANAKIYSISGTFGSSSIPSGAALATSDNLDVSTVGVGLASVALVTLTFSGVNQIALANATHYAVTLEYSSASFLIEVGQDSTSPTAAGNEARYNGTSWSAFSGDDVAFYVYDNAGAVVAASTPQLMSMGVGA